jgi:type I restriction enzyme, S subunit
MGSEWQELKLSDAVNLIGGGTPKRSHPEYWGGPIPWLSVKDFNNDYRHVGSAQESISELGLSKSSTKILEEGQLIISARGTVGALAQLSRSMAFNQSCYGIDAKPDRVTNDFLYYLIKYSIANFKQITHGAVFDTITRETFDHILVTLPPLTEQRTIAHILGSLDDKIELNRRMNETLEAMAKALFSSWFIDFDPVIDNALSAGNFIPEELQARAALRESLCDARKPLPDDIRDLFPSEFKFTEKMGWIPKGWEIRSVEDVVEVNPRVPLKKNVVASFVDMKALPNCGFSVMEIEKKPYSGGAKFNNGDVLLARITPCLENGKTGIVDFLDGDEVGFGSTEFIVLRSKGAIRTAYIACLSRYIGFRDHCIQSMVGSSGRQRVQNACFSNYYLALPSAHVLLTSFDKLVSGNFGKIAKHTEQTRVLSNFRDTLLPKLLSGEIRIPEAEQLLEAAI